MLGLVVLTAILGAIVVVYVLPYLRSPLKQYPGPILAKFTNWWRTYHALDAHNIQVNAHKKYGPVVQLGPNCISLSDASLVKTIYNTRGNYLKSDFYAVNDIIQGGHRIENVFSTRSNHYHRKYIRPISKIYSMNNILTLEILADKTTVTYCRRLEEEFMSGKNAGRVCNIVDWMLWYAWDVVGEVTFDEPIGFLDNAGDIDNMLHTAEQALDYFGTVGNMPHVDNWLAKNPYYRLGGPSIDWAGVYCAKRMFPRLQAAAEKGEKRSSKDFLDYFIGLKEEIPAVVNENVIIGYMLINILAGADTTAITLRSIIYYLLKNPSTYTKLLAELDAANLTEPIQYRTTENLPYLAAVVKESMRLHPGIGVLLERIVPDGGLELRDGRVIPPGTIVGLNPWVIHRDAAVFGESVNEFVPERWLRGSGESEDAFQARLKDMKECDLTFGAGNRVCIGRHLALMEVYKIIPTLLLKYRFEPVEPDREWVVKSKWFMVQDKLDVRLSKR